MSEPKFSLPFTPRYVWPLVIALLALDLFVVAGVGLGLYGVGKRAFTFKVERLECRSYAQSSGDSVYMIARCTKESP